jgi:hypothetical protein
MMKWTGHVACIGGKRIAYRTLVGKPKERHKLKDLGVDGVIVIKRFLRRLDGVAWTGFVWLKTGTSGGLL